MRTRKIISESGNINVTDSLSIKELRAGYAHFVHNRIYAWLKVDEDLETSISNFTEHYVRQHPRARRESIESKFEEITSTTGFESTKTLKKRMVEAFDDWADRNLKGYGKSRERLLEEIEKQNLNPESDGTYQLGSVDTPKGKNISLKLRYNPKQHKLEIIVREKSIGEEQVE